MLDERAGDESCGEEIFQVSESGVRLRCSRGLWDQASAPVDCARAGVGFLETDSRAKYKLFEDAVVAATTFCI